MAPQKRPLTQPGSLNYNPAWSPQGGDWIAFTSEQGRARQSLPHASRRHGDVERLTADAAYDDQATFFSRWPADCLCPLFPTRAEGFAECFGSWTSPPAKSGADHRERGGDFQSQPGLQMAAGYAFSSDRDSLAFPTAKSRWERLQLVDIYLIQSRRLWGFGVFRSMGTSAATQNGRLTVRAS